MPNPRLEQDAKALLKAIQQGNQELTVSSLIICPIAVLNIVCINLARIIGLTHIESSKEA